MVVPGVVPIFRAFEAPFFAVRPLTDDPHITSQVDIHLLLSVFLI